MRKLSLAAALSFAAIALSTIATSQSFAATVINVSLWDKGADKEMPSDLGIAMNGDMNLAPMGITAKPNSAKAGPVTFTATNGSEELIHEMLIVPYTDGMQLPYVADDYRVDEEAAHHMGEVSELDPGAAGSLTVDLAPGKYALLCNMPGHYMSGMWTIIDVTP